jgi:hypothetical protein
MLVMLIESLGLLFSPHIQVGIHTPTLYDALFIQISFTVPDDVKGFFHELITGSG